MTTKFTIYLVKSLTLLLFSQLLFFSCAPSKENIEQPQVSTELTQEQQSAFDALNSIQVKSEGHLYSTFSGIFHPQFPYDSTFTITQSEFLFAIEQLLIRYDNNITVEERAILTKQAVLAQDNYLVLQCNNNPLGSKNWKTNDIPISGTWILPEVLNLRDIVLVW